MKYDKMIEKNQIESQSKIAEARKEIKALLKEESGISVAKLARRTGLSRGFFYKNPTVRKELDEAINYMKMVEKTSGGVNKKSNEEVESLRNELKKEKILNKELQRQNQEFKEINVKQNEEIESLKEKLYRKEISLLKQI